MKPESVKPIYMSYETFSYLDEFIEQEQERLHGNFVNAMTFIEYDYRKEGKKNGKTAGEKAHEIFCVGYSKLDKMKKELKASAMVSNKDHPNPKMREFWGM